MYGLIGKKLDHSFSADFFNKKFKEEGIDEYYQLFPLPSISDLPVLLRNNPALKGLNVTIPYKKSVIPFLNSISNEAKEIGAVNVIKITRDNGEFNLTGFNSDCLGFKNSLLPLLCADINKALILGTGGASKAICYVLKQLNIQPTFVSRSPAEGQLTYNDLNKEIIEENLLIVNTTPLGMYPEVNTCPDIPYEYLTNRHICYDLVYNPVETKFMKLALQQGAKVKNGYEMLVGQALEAWRIWTE